MHRPIPVVQLNSFFLSWESRPAELQHLSVCRDILWKHIMTSNSMSFSSRLRCPQSANIDKQPTLAEMMGFLFKKHKEQAVPIFGRNEHIPFYIELSKDCTGSLASWALHEQAYSRPLWQTFVSNVHIQFTALSGINCSKCLLFCT